MAGEEGGEEVKERAVQENAVMGIKGELFTLLMELLHDLSGHFKGKSYTVVIEVTPEFVTVNKIPKE